MICKKVGISSIYTNVDVMIVVQLIRFY